MVVNSFGHSHRALIDPTLQHNMLCFESNVLSLHCILVRIIEDNCHLWIFLYDVQKDDEIMVTLIKTVCFA